MPEARAGRQSRYQVCVFVFLNMVANPVDKGGLRGSVAQFENRNMTDEQVQLLARTLIAQRETAGVGQDRA